MCLARRQDPGVYTCCELYTAANPPPPLRLVPPAVVFHPPPALPSLVLKHPRRVQEKFAFANLGRDPSPTGIGEAPVTSPLSLVADGDGGTATEPAAAVAESIEGRARAPVAPPAQTVQQPQSPILMGLR